MKIGFPGNPNSAKDQQGSLRLFPSLLGDGHFACLSPNPRFQPNLFLGACPQTPTEGRSASPRPPPQGIGMGGMTRFASVGGKDSCLAEFSAD
jgi:hypothetical protein